MLRLNIARMKAPILSFMSRKDKVLASDSSLGIIMFSNFTPRVFLNLFSVL